MSVLAIPADVAPGRDATGVTVKALCHDMRQPLATIMALSSTATYGEGADDRVTQALSRITAQATGLLDMIRATLDDDPETRREPVHVPALVGEIVSDLRVTYRGSLLISCKNAECASVLADRTMVRRAVVNLLDNATRAAGPAGNVGVKVVGKSSGVEILVEDDGPGFGQISFGAGIGLDVVRRVAADYDGRLQFWTGRQGGVRARLRLSRVPKSGGHEDRPL